MVDSLLYWLANDIAIYMLDREKLIFQKEMSVSAAQRQTTGCVQCPALAPVEYSCSLMHTVNAKQDMEFGVAKDWL